MPDLCSRFAGPAVPGQISFPSAPIPEPFDRLDRLSTNRTGALRGRPMRSMARPPFFLPPPETPAVSVLAVAAALAGPAPAAASPDELVPVPAELTLRGCSRRANAVFRMASHRKQFPEAVRSKPMQSSERPPGQKNIPSPNVNRGRSRQANAVFRVTSH